MIAVNDILLGLATPHAEVPQALLDAAREQREAVTEALLPVLDAWVARTEDPDAVLSEDDSWLPDYAMFLLAEFREPRAFDLFVRLCELDGEVSYAFLGDMLTDDMQSLLASTCMGREEALYAFVANEQRYEWARHAVGDALLILVVNREIPLDAFAARMVDIAQSQSRTAENRFWTLLASLQFDLCNEVLMQTLRDAFAEGLVDREFAHLDDLEEQFSEQSGKGLASVHLSRDIIRDAGNGIAWLIHARNRSDDELGDLDDGWDEAPLPYVREAPKVGRNDPCPCGSGRKYKKCCLS